MGYSAWLSRRSPPSRWCGGGFFESVRGSLVPGRTESGHGGPYLASAAWCSAVERSPPGASGMRRPLARQHQAHRGHGADHECRSMVARAVCSPVGSHARGGRVPTRHDLHSRGQGPAHAVTERPHRLSGERAVSIRPALPRNHSEHGRAAGPRSQAPRPARPARARSRESSRPPAAVPHEDDEVLVAMLTEPASAMMFRLSHRGAQIDQACGPQLASAAKPLAAPDGGYRAASGERASRKG